MSRTLFLLFLLYAVRGYTQTPVSGDVSGVWMAANSPYFINGSVTVPAGQTLTIEPGVEILSPGNGRIYVNGALIARGTTMDSIRFLCPDSIAWAGSVIFGASSSGSILQYVRLDRWGNTAYAGDIGAIQLLTGSVNITRSLVSNSEASGIMADQDISPAITDNAFTGGTYAINARPGSLSNVTRNTNANIHLINANISGTAVMPQPGPGSLYVLDEGFTIVAGGTLTIQPGTRLQSASAQGGINVYGSLIANGTATDSIFFSTPDSLTYGGTIIVNPGAVNVQFQYIHIDHWGNVSFAGDIGALRLLTSPVSITHSVVSNSAGTGIMANENISPVISGNVFYGCTYAISAQPGSLSAVTANRNATIHLINANISDSAVLPLPGPGSFYLLDQGFTILQGASLTLQPGLLIQSTSTADHINVYGSLIASGTATDSIRFVTSDSTAYGGTSYGGSIVFNSGGGSSILQYASFNRWGNTSYAGDIGTIWLMNAQVNISACSFSDPQGTAIMLNSAISPVVTGNRFTNCPFAIQAQPGSLTYVTANSNANIGLINSNVSDSAVLPLPGPGSYYFLNQGFTILQGASLTLQPGLLIQSTSTADHINVYGSLIARGTATDSIRFVTSDSTAYGGTSYGGSIVFNSGGGSSILQYASFNRWGNTSYAGDIGTIWLMNAQVNISACSFSDPQGTAIMLNSAISPVVTGNRFTNCPFAIQAQPGSLTYVTANSNANIGLINSNVSDSAVLPLPGPGSYYFLNQGFTILQGASLTLLPGLLIQSTSAADQIDVYGSLIARGTAMDSIRFTTTDSAAYGGTVIFHASGDSSFLQYASFNRWGNTSYAGDLGAIWLLEPAASIANCSFSNAQGTGIVAGNDPSPSINACLFSHCPRAIIALPGGLSRVLDNSNANIYIANDNVTDTAVMPSPGPGSYYVLAGGFTINQHASLTIGPGTEIRSGSGADNISVYGTLIAQGSAADSIRLTSTDSNAYGGCLQFMPDAGPSLLTFVSINRWGNTSYAGDVGAVRLLTSSVTISNSTVSNAASYGLYAQLTSPLKISECNFVNNQTGIYVATGSPVFDSCTIASNAGWGVDNTSGSMTDTTDARYCWWGVASGPYQSALNPEGGGNMVSTRVLFNPWLDSALAVGAVVTLAARVILQGAYSASDGLMADSLRAQGWLPQSEPYTAMGYAAVGDMATETMAAGIYARTGPTAITDWVWLELRSSSDPTQVLATRSALLQRDGWIKDMDGLSPVSFRHVFAGRYYVVIKHRNHLAAMTAGPIGLSAGSVATVDFSSPSAATYGVNALTAINGVMALWAGDANGDGRISYMGTNNDKDAVLALIGPGNPNNSVSGYQQADCNLDGKVKYNGAANDKTIILNNVGVNTPDNILTAQLP